MTKRIICACPDTTGFPHCTAVDCKRITPPSEAQRLRAELRHLQEAVRTYYTTKADQIGSSSWLQLKGAARTKAVAARKRTFDAADETLRALVGLNQHLLFIKFHPKEDDRPVRMAIPVEVPWREERIKQVWTLYQYTDENTPPSLPYRPAHHVNAFMEDKIHDWNIDSKGRFRYASRATDEPVWVLVELKY